VAKRREPLTGKAKRNNDLTYDVLGGATFEEVAKSYGFNSRQAAQKAFRLTVVNFFLPYQLEKLGENRNKINHLRGLWKNSMV